MALEYDKSESSGSVTRVIREVNVLYSSVDGEGPQDALLGDSEIEVMDEEFGEGLSVLMTVGIWWLLFADVVSRVRQVGQGVFQCDNVSLFGILPPYGLMVAR